MEHKLTVNILFKWLYTMSQHRAGTCQSEWFRSILCSYHTYRDKSARGCLYLCPNTFVSKFLCGREKMQEQIANYYISSERGFALLRRDIEAYFEKVAFTEGRRQEYINAITGLFTNAPNVHPKDKEFVLETVDDSSEYLAQMCFRAIIVLM